MAPQRATCIITAILLLSAPPLSTLAQATPTDPSLGLHSVASLPGSPRILRIEGTFHSDDLAQVPFPLQVLVHTTSSHSTSYLRIEPGIRSLWGSSESLRDGLQAEDIPALLASGSPEDRVELVELSENRIDFTLPDWFPTGVAQVQLFVWNEGEPVLSNPLTVQIGGTR